MMDLEAFASGLFKQAMVVIQERIYPWMPSYLPIKVKGKGDLINLYI